MVVQEDECVRKCAVHLGSALQFPPTLFKTAASHVTGTVGDRAGAGIRSRAGGRVLAAQAGLTAVVAVHGVSGTTTADVIDGGDATEITLELFVEAEDGALAAAVDVACAAAAGDEGFLRAGVEAGQGGWTGCAARVGRPGILQADDIPGSSTAGVDGWATSVRDGRMRLNDAVI
jgi:hypothetical protein